MHTNIEGHEVIAARAARLEVRGLDKRFAADAPVLSGVSLDVAPGAILALLGPSGCGKTTLLRCIAGLESPDAGCVTLDNRELVGIDVSIAPERRGVGMVFQDPALFPHMNVAKNVALGVQRAERRGPRVSEALALVGMDGYEERTPDQLSGGQQQRVAIARAVAARPKVLLLDEPFSDLDARLRSELRGELRELLAKLGTTAIFVTHDQEEALLIGDEVAVMLDGVIAQRDAASVVYEQPATRDVATFLGDAEFVACEANGDHADTPFGRVPLHHRVCGAVEILLRPERLDVRPGGEALIDGVEFYGHDAVYRLLLPSGVRVRARVVGPPAFGEGDRVGVRFTGPPTQAYPLSQEGARG